MGMVLHHVDILIWRERSDGDLPIDDGIHGGGWAGDVVRDSSRNESSRNEVEGLRQMPVMVEDENQWVEEQTREVGGKVGMQDCVDKIVE